MAVGCGMAVGGVVAGGAVVVAGAAGGGVGGGEPAHWWWWWWWLYVCEGYLMDCSLRAGVVFARVRLLRRARGRL